MEFLIMCCALENSNSLLHYIEVLPKVFEKYNYMQLHITFNTYSMRR